MTPKATVQDQNVFIGIDFGTTKTMVASYDPTKKSAKPLTIGRGTFEKPTSMYATEAGDLLFGDDADDLGITDLPNHIRRFKMKLGKPGLAQMGRKSGTAQQLTAEFLGNLRNQLESQVLHTSVKRAILTVPAIFGPAQRHELKSAAYDAGFTQVELLEEPVAAGIAYCDHQSDLSKQLRFIVVDWGGGTFDVAQLERSSSGEVKVHEDFVGGLESIGGEVFDDELWGMASRSLVSAGLGTLDAQGRENLGRYRRELIRAKEALSSQLSVTRKFNLENGRAEVTLDRADFNKEISPMIQKAASFVSDLIVRAHNAGCPPEFILLAGGTSRIPLIAEELERVTGVKCRQWSEGREAIALGAAIKANQLWGKEKIAEHAPKIAESHNMKVAAMSQYRMLLEAAWLDKTITPDERKFLGKKRKELGLTPSESKSLQIQILGVPIEETQIGSFQQVLKQAQQRGLITVREFDYYTYGVGDESRGWKLLMERGVKEIPPKFVAMYKVHNSHVPTPANIIPPISTDQTEVKSPPHPPTPANLKKEPNNAQSPLAENSNKEIGAVIGGVVGILIYLVIRQDSHATIRTLVGLVSLGAWIGGLIGGNMDSES